MSVCYYGRFSARAGMADKANDSARSTDQYRFTRAGCLQKKADSLDNSYYRYGIQAGWNYESAYGISTRL